MDHAHYFGTIELSPRSSGGLAFRQNQFIASPEGYSKLMLLGSSKAENETYRPYHPASQGLYFNLLAI
jgi:hypothetical protein